MIESRRATAEELLEYPILGEIPVGPQSFDVDLPGLLDDSMLLDNAGRNE